VSKRNFWIGAILIGLLGVLAAAHLVLEKRAVVEAAGVQAPRFEVDPFWPKPLPNHWLLGNVIGVSVDAQDHIWIIHRQGSLEAMENYAVANPPGPKRQAGVVESECCGPAPAILEFDEQGNLLTSWGGQDGPGYVWPLSNHGITVDFKGNVWIGGNAALSRQHGNEIHPGWKIPDADRQGRTEQRQQRHREPRKTGEDVYRSED